MYRINWVAWQTTDTTTAHQKSAIRPTHMSISESIFHDLSNHTWFIYKSAIPGDVLASPNCYIYSNETKTATLKPYPISSVKPISVHFYVHLTANWEGNDDTDHGFAAHTYRDHFLRSVWNVGSVWNCVSVEHKGCIVHRTVKRIGLPDYIACVFFVCLCMSVVFCSFLSCSYLVVE